MKFWNSHRTIRRLGFAAAAVLIAFTAPGCGDDDEDDDSFVEEPTPTPTHEPGPPHSLMRVGSTMVGGGKLAVNEVPTAFVVVAECLGGTGDHCDGGTVVYTADSPGFNSLSEDDPGRPLYRLPDGVTVNIEVTQVDADASLGISGSVLDEPGEIGLVNTTPELHNHPTWQMVAPGGEEHPEEKHISFRLHADGYESSDEMTVTIEVYDEEDGGHDDDHD